MTLILIVIVAVLAALAGYVAGTRRERESVAPAETRPAIPATPVPATAIDEAGTERFGAEKARIIRSREVEAARLHEEIAERDAPLERDAEVAHERERLFRDLADARTETARYRQIVVDIENNAPPPILAGVGEPDDLKLIVGVGPVLERMLHNLGITTFRQIARWTEREVAEFDAKLPEFPGRIQRDQWVVQARALHESKYGQGVPGMRAG
jgi:predicted flap endonuclease-1-like 5' DNA nuclease